MANPTPYDPTYEYGGATNVIPGDQLDNDFAKLKVTTDQIIAALGDVRRSDGKLNNGVVTDDSLDPDLKQDLYNEFTEGAAGLVDEAEAWANQAHGYANDAAAEKTAAVNAKNDAVSAKNDAEQAAADAQQIASDMQDAVDEWLAAAPWVGRAIGEPFPIFTHLGAPEPPTDNPNFRFIKLTASDSYNAGVLVNENVSGSAPLIVATAVIDFPDSPLHGKTVHLLNTEGRFVRPRVPEGVLQDDAIQNITGSVASVVSDRAVFGSTSGAFDRSTPNQGAVAANPGGTSIPNVLTFDASRVARTTSETRPKNISATFFMRIY